MGGGHAGAAEGGDIRTKVWSLTGGPFCRPKYWRRNTAIAMAGIFLVCIPIAIKSAQLEDTIDWHWFYAEEWLCDGDQWWQGNAFMSVTLAGRGYKLFGSLWYIHATSQLSCSSNSFSEMVQELSKSRINITC